MCAFMICVEISGVDYKTNLGILIEVSWISIPIYVFFIIIMKTIFNFLFCIYVHTYLVYLTGIYQVTKKIT